MGWRSHRLCCHPVAAHTAPWFLPVSAHRVEGFLESRGVTRTVENLVLRGRLVENAQSEWISRSGLTGQVL